MNSITTIIDKSDYDIYDDFLNFQIDGYFLDEKLNELYPDNSYKGLIPTLLFAMEIEKESEIVWSRIFPKAIERTICPILMCPDDRDFSCTLIVAEIFCTDTEVTWKRIGVDLTRDFEPEKVGSKVEWFDKLGSFTFDKLDYEKMTKEFRIDFELKKKEWLEKSSRQRGVSPLSLSQNRA